MKIPHFGALGLTAALTFSACNASVERVQRCKQGVVSGIQALQLDTRGRLSGLTLVPSNQPLNTYQLSLRLSALNCRLPPPNLDDVPIFILSTHAHAAEDTARACWWAASSSNVQIDPTLLVAHQNAQLLELCFAQITHQRAEFNDAWRLGNSPSK